VIWQLRITVKKIFYVHKSSGTGTVRCRTIEAIFLEFKKIVSFNFTDEYALILPEG